MLAYPGIELWTSKGAYKTSMINRPSPLTSFMHSTTRSRPSYRKTAPIHLLAFWTVVPLDTRRNYLLALQYSVYLIEAGERNGSRFSAFWLL